MRNMFEGDADLLRRYLLGELSEPEVDRLEQELLENEDLFQHAEMVEAELLAEVARGELTGAQREHVLRRWRATEGGRYRLAMARKMVEIGRERKPWLERVAALSRHWQVWVPAAAAAALLAVVVNNYRSFEAHAPRMPTEITGPVAPAPPAMPAMPPPPMPPPQEREAPVEETTPTPAPVPPEAVAPVEITLDFTGTTRGAGGQMVTVEIPKTAQEVEFRVPLDHLSHEEYTAYQVTLRRTASEKEVFHRKNVRLSDGTLNLQVSGTQVQAGTYVLEIQGIQKDGELDPLPWVGELKIERGDNR